ncbi:MAG: hypothetical protein K2X77_17195 [Candidatus Obscuribacterales bacterium]|jgi:hypothetical protein|nr:hypothetical protein [Candidatus Obscuribacterales bacterium]
MRSTETEKIEDKKRSTKKTLPRTKEIKSTKEQTKQLGGAIGNGAP